MLYLIDAHNLIYKIKDLRSLISSGNVAEARSGLIPFFQNFPEYRKFILFFDGHPRDSEKLPKEIYSENSLRYITIKNNLEINYSLNRTADKIIIQFLKQKVKQEVNKVNGILISNDKKLKFLAQPYIKKIIDSNCFAEFVYCHNKKIVSEKNFSSN